jgi:RNA polymerase sigma-32 factor
MQAQELNQLVSRIAGTNIKRILTREEELKATIAWRDHRDEKARLLIVQSYAKLVAKEVRRMRHYKASPSDLASEGLMGITVALDKFDPDAGFRFSTYAIHWIRAKMNEHVMHTEGIMRFSASDKQKRMLFGYRKVMTDLKMKARNSGQRLTRQALQEKTAEILRVTPEDISQFNAAMGYAKSFDAPLVTSTGNESQTLADILPDGSPLAEDVLNDQQREQRMSSDVAAAMLLLNPREKSIITLRKLAPEGDEMTLEELSQIHKVSRERIRQIEVMALKKLQKSLASTRKMLEDA